MFKDRHLLAFLVSLLLFVSSCSKKSEANDPLESYATAPLTAGVGLGDLRLGQTTLGEFIRKIGIGTVAVVASNEIGFELFFKGEQIRFLFLVDGDCKAIWGEGFTLAAVKDLAGFLRQYPSCENVTLHSISVKAGSGVEDTYFKGSTVDPFRPATATIPSRVELFGRAKLLGSIESSYSHEGDPYQPRGLWVAGLSSDDPEWSIAYPSGILFYYEAPDGGKDIEKTVIKRITVFQPDRR